MRKWIDKASALALLLSLAELPAMAQQRPQYSQYFTNPFLLNPALAGTAAGMDARIGMRLQWVGFRDAPRSFYGTFHTRVGESRKRFFAKNQIEPRYYHGFGAQVMNDITGPTSRTTANVSYAFNQALTRTIRAGLGASIGLQQFSLSGSDLRYSNGPSGVVQPFSRVFPDASIGLWVYSKHVFVGGSMQQLFRNTFNAADGQLGVYTAYRHGFATAGYNFTTKSDWTITPSMLVKIVKPAPVMVDVNLKARYREQFWAGVSYRHQDAVVAAVGVGLGPFLDASYSYDIITSDIAQYQRGTHELSLGLRLGQQRRTYNPPDFWR